ncbi:MAG: RimK/LysX family protein [Gammaproteobacteria bacterium]|nr:RimK/LysX family protein [Gammaproteobacteria bacterium]
MKTKFIATLLLVSLPALSQAAVRAPKMILGWLETTQILGSDMRIKTKLDVGAKTSSMQATNIEYFEKNGKKWVRFDFTDEDVDTEQPHTLRLEGPLVREAEIKRHGAPNVTRPVVTKEICVYNQLYRTEFTLTDRGNFNYAILLGRSFLSKVALVDSSSAFLSRPNCEGDTTVLDIKD